MGILSATVLLFLIMDPLGNLPIFISILKSMSPRRRKYVLIRELLIALLIILLFLFAGPSILLLLNLRTETISIAGAIILFIIAIRMIFPHASGNIVGDTKNNEEPLVVPLAVPLVAGPSILAFIVAISSKGNINYKEWLLAIFLAWLGTAAILMSSNIIFRLLKERGLIAMERLMGMILVMLSVQLFLDGLGEYFQIAQLFNRSNTGLVSGLQPNQ